MKYVSLLLLLASCAASQKINEPIWVENDKQPIEEPSQYWSGLYWDGADKIVFRPLSRVWLFEVKHPAQNVNVLEEVPNSSWYTNRLALAPMSAERMAKGPCQSSINLKGPLIVKGGKVNGANPGFRVKDPATGSNYLLKFDSPDAEPYRATAADVIGSKIYWAAGFETPCNEVIYFDPKILVLGEGASKKDELGNKTPMSQSDISNALAGVSKNKEGLTRGSASLFIDGRPIGPFTYEGTRSDDPNDIIAHENRRELRGSRLLAAWTNHFDAREQNTLTSFIKDESGKGYVQHYIIDFGDIFGSQWEADQMSRRFGHGYYFDASQVVIDLISLGSIIRPWDLQKQYDEGRIFGYYNIESFIPQDWKAGYPNTAFNFMDEKDAFWMAKIISRFGDEHIEKLIEVGKIPNQVYNKYLSAMLRGRRDKIVNYYFRRTSPLDRLRVKEGVICVEDLLITGGFSESNDAFYRVSFDGKKWKNPTQVVEDGFCQEVSNLGRAFTLSAKVRRADQVQFAKEVQFRFRYDSKGLKLVQVKR